MNAIILKTTFTLLMAVLINSCTEDGTSKGRSEDGLEVQSEFIPLEDILFRANGTCDNLRSYQVLESEILNGTHGNSLILQMLLMDDGTMILAQKDFNFTSRGEKVSEFVERKESVSKGTWKRKGNAIDTSLGLLTQEFEDPYGIYLMHFTTISKNKTIYFRRVKKVSEKYIPVSESCGRVPVPTEIGRSSKFSILKDVVPEKDVIFRNTPDIHRVGFTLDTRLTPGRSDKIFKSHCLTSPAECSFGFEFKRDQTGTFFGHNGEKKISWDFVVRSNDDLIKFERLSGESLYLIPAADLEGYYFEDTEEFIGE